MKPTHVKWSTYNNFDVENNDEDLKFKVGDHVRIWKYKKLFLQKVTLKICSKILNFVTKNVIKTQKSWKFVIQGLEGEEIGGLFYEKEFQKTKKKEFVIEKVIRKKVNVSGRVMITRLTVGLV